MNLPGNDILLSARNLTVEYRQAGPGPQKLAAVSDVSLDIRQGDILALVGESGSGKTTLAHAILRLLPVASGRVLFRGRDSADMNRVELLDMRRNIQPVFQDPLASLSPRRTVLQTLLEPLNHFRIGAPGLRKEAAVGAIASVDLDPGLLDRYPHELSGGQRQRIALARALVTEPDLIVADEPVSSLDVSMQARITDMILDLRDRLGVAFLFVSHDLSVVRRLADTVAVMYGGKLVESGPAARIFENPAHPYTRALLHAVPVADPGHPPPQVLEGEPPSLLTPAAGCVFHKRCADVMPGCSGREPGQQTITDTGTDQGKHQVRCHLYNA